MSLSIEIRAILVIGWSAVGLASCSSSEHVELRDHGCQREEVRAGADPLENLRCVSWQRDRDRSLAIALRNFPATCGGLWQAQASRADHALDILIANENREIAACGD